MTVSCVISRVPPYHLKLERLNWPKDLGRLVGGDREGEGPADAPAPSIFGFLLSGDRFDPAEGFLDPLADTLAYGVAGGTRRAAIDCRRAPAQILRHMRRHLHRAQFVDEVLGVIGFVGTPRVIACGRSAHGSIMCNAATR